LRFNHSRRPGRQLTTPGLQLDEHHRDCGTACADDQRRANQDEQAQIGVESAMRRIGEAQNDAAKFVSTPVFDFSAKDPSKRWSHGIYRVTM